jgi:hypothetical protein
VDTVLGTRDPQRSLFDAIAQFGIKAVKKLGFYGKLALHGHEVFKDEDFEGIYCLDNGRVSVPPSVLALARLLQHYAGISDAEVVERCRYDLRWKVALDLDPETFEAPFSKSTFQAFRTRLTLHSEEGIAFERSVGVARELGMLPNKLCVALDSSPVRSRGAVKDTFCLLSDAVAEVVRAVARKWKRLPEEVADEAGLSRHITAPSIKGSEVVDWNSEEDKSRFLDGLLDDCDRAVELADNAECASAQLDLLKKIITQDVESGAQDDQHPEIRRGVAKDRVSSVTDPEARHSRKSSGKTYTGHKAHVAVDQASGVIVAAEVGAPGEADGEKVKQLIDRAEEVTGCDVERALGDCAYGSDEAQRQAQECDVDLKTKMPAHRKGLFGPGHFEISEDHRSATCPAGHQSEKQYRAKDGVLHKWSATNCHVCPLRDKCTKSKSRQRQMLVRPNFHDRRRREKYARSKEGRAVLRERVVVEHAIGRLKNLGAGTARYIGRAKTNTQWLWSAAVANLSLIWGRQDFVSA